MFAQGGSDYILVMALITKSHTEFLSRHTHWLRERHQIRGGRRPTDTAIALEGEYEDSVGIDQKRHERSRRSSQSSTGQDLQVPDFWYFDLPPMKERTLLENLSIFVDVYWAYYTANSGVLRYRTSFKELESELQMQFTRQAWEAVRPWVFFSACANGLTNYVNAWTKAHPRLARTTQRFPNERNALLEVCRSDHYQLKIAEILIDQGAEIYHIPGTSPRSPLCMAAGFGHEAVMKLLLEKCPDIINTPGPSGLAPISTAVLQNPPNAVSIVEMLLNHGANANEIADNLNERRPLHAAAINQNRGVLQVLLNSGAYIDAQDDRGFTPLMSSIMEDDYDACRLLIGHGASVDLKDVDGNSLFTVAVLERANPLIAELLLKYDVDIDSRDRFGDSAMHLAAERGRADSAKALIDYGININATNASGRTALHVVAAEGDEEIAKMLIASGADINAIDISGFNALSCAAYMGNIEISLLLVEKTTDINLQSCAGEPPLSLAACTGEEALVNLLLNAGAEVGLQEPGPHCPFIDPEERLSGYCRDPVLAALAKGHVKIAKIIMEFAGGREEGSEYAEALGMLDIDDMDEFERWSTVRRRNAPENRPDVVLFRDDVNIRFKKLLKSNMDRTAAEVGILWEKDWSF